MEPGNLAVVLTGFVVIVLTIIILTKPKKKSDE